MAKILVTASTFPRWQGDTIPPFVFHLANGLANKQHEVHVLAPHTRGAAREERMGSVHVHRFRYAVGAWESLCYDGGILQNLKHQPAKWGLVPAFLASESYTLARLVRKHRFDLVSAQWFVPQGIVAAIGKPWLGCPLVVTGHGGDIFASRSKIRQAMVRFTARRADSCTVNSRAMRRELQQIAGVDPVVIPMGVDVARFAYCAPELRHPEHGDSQGPRILFVGRLVEKKGVKYLIQAMPRVLSDRPGAKLTIVGDGPDLAELRSLVDQLQLTPWVTFAGAVPNEKLGEYYRNNDIFVAPSILDRAGDTEALGVVILEAAASGTPIVATNVGGIPDIISDGVTGLLAEEANPDQLAAAILRIASDPKLGQRLALNARRLVEQEFSWDSVIDRFDTLISGILSPGAPNQIAPHATR